MRQCRRQGSGCLGCEGVVMMPIKLWVVAGNANSGKSMTIGHLMGNFGKGPDGLKSGTTVGPREIPSRGGGYLNVFGRRQSLQEAKKTVADAIRIFESQARSESRKSPTIVLQSFNVLLALRTDRINKLPPAYEYLTRFIDRGWQLERLAILSPTPADRAVYRRFGTPTCYLDKRDVDRLQMIGRVRDHFGWA
jgi:hypothetical protein